MKEHNDYLIQAELPLEKLKKPRPDMQIKTMVILNTMSTNNGIYDQ